MTSYVRLVLVASLALLGSPARAQLFSWTTVAGLPPQVGSADGPAASARFNSPTGIAADAAGNLYVSDAFNDTIRKIAVDGTVSTLAGTPGQFGSVDGTGAAARFNSPYGLAVDAAGNVYVADRGNHVVRKITGAGVVTTFAGSAGSAGSADGAGSAARFNNPYGLTFDGEGNLVVADRGNQTVRKISPAGVVSTFAGSPGVAGSADGNGSAARFSNPSGIAYDGTGNFYLADTANHTIRKIAADGSVTTLAGTAGSSGTTSGTGAAARFAFPVGVVVGPTGDVFVADASNDTIRRVTPAGAVTLFAGGADQRGYANGAGNAARFFNPIGITRNIDGNLYVADTFNHTIRRITSTAIVSNFAGPQGNFGNADGSGSDARFNYPHGITTDRFGNLFVADTRNSAIRRVTPDGVVTTHATLSGNSIYGIAIDAADNIAVSSRASHTIRVIAPPPSTDTLEIGVAGQSGSTDGPANTARFNLPEGIVLAVDQGVTVLYVADTGNHVIRRVSFTSTGPVVSTLAGQAGSPGSADGAGAAARFSSPRGVAVDFSGNVLVADSGSHTIRRVTPAGVVTTVAGTAFSSGTTNGVGAAARFNGPSALAVDSGGRIYVSDTFNHSIRHITPGGSVTTIGGLPGFSGYADGTASAARFFEPSGIAISGSALFVVEDSNNIVVRGAVDSMPQITAPPQSQAALAGGSVTFTVGATGGGLNYQWRFNGVALPGATGSSYTVTNASNAAAGSYTVDITNTAGAVTSGTATLSIAPPGSEAGRITNLAIRSQAGTGAQTLIVGVAVGGEGTSGTKPILFRAVGPTLTGFGVTGALSDPKLELYASSTNTKMAENDDWAGSAQVTSIGAQVGAFALAGAASKDAALYSASVASGSYSVLVTGAAGTTGIALAEIYDATPAGTAGPTTPRLTNVSARTQVGTGGDILIAGFNISGQTSKTVLIRAIGPTLGAFGVTGALANPRLELFSGPARINENDDWGGSTQLAAAFASVGAFPLANGTRDAVLRVTLAPGSYTAQVSGVNNTTGVALIEVYELP